MRESIALTTFSKQSFFSLSASILAIVPLNLLSSKWLVKKLSSEEMVYYFGEEAICSKGAYNTAMTKFRKNAFKEESYSDTINIMKDRLKQLQNERNKEQTGQ